MIALSVLVVCGYGLGGLGRAISVVAVQSRQA